MKNPCFINVYVYHVKDRNMVRIWKPCEGRVRCSDLWSGTVTLRISILSQSLLTDSSQWHVMLLLAFFPFPCSSLVLQPDLTVSIKLQIIWGWKDWYCMGQHSYIYADIKTERKETDKKGTANCIIFNYTSRLQELKMVVSNTNLNKSPMWAIV